MSRRFVWKRYRGNNVPVPFPFVAVTLPDDTPPAYVAGLVTACSQAYPEGNCHADSAEPPASVPSDGQPPQSEGATDGRSESGGESPEPPPADSSGKTGVIVANVTWPTPTTATVLLGLPHWRNHRWIERSVPFKEQDQALERYRALGFTIGSLAVTIAEVAKLEQEARETTTSTDAVSDTRETESRPVEPPPPPPPQTNPPAPIYDPPDAVDIPIVTNDDEPSRLFVRGYAAGELGEGFDALRRGGSVALGLFGAHWGARISGHYGNASGDGLDATFAGLEVSADVRLVWPALEADLCIGGGYGHLNARIDKEASRAFPSGTIAVHLMPTRWVVAPYLGVGARVLQVIETDVPELDPLGPFTPFVQLGLVLSSEPDDDATRR